MDKVDISELGKRKIVIKRPEVGSSTVPTTLKKYVSPEVGSSTVPTTLKKYVSPEFSKVEEVRTGLCCDVDKRKEFLKKEAEKKEEEKKAKEEAIDLAEKAIETVKVEYTDRAEEISALYKKEGIPTIKSPETLEELVKEIAVKDKALKEIMLAREKEAAEKSAVKEVKETCGRYVHDGAPSVPWGEKDSHSWWLFDKVMKTEKTSGIHRILLYGVPGTGKTTAACKSSGTDGFYSITLNEESSVAEIIGMWIPRGNEFVWYPGNGIRAWTEDTGKLLVVNEIDHACGSVLTVMHAIMDDKRIAGISLPDGNFVRPKERFRVIATMNGDVSDLPAALADRFDVKIEIKEPHPEAVARLDRDLRELVKAAYSTKKLNITFREIVSFGKLRKSIGEDAFYVCFGNLAEDVKAVLKLGRRTE